MDTIVIHLTSPDVPDLTLLDLPGIVRTAVNGQNSTAATRRRATRSKRTRRESRCCILSVGEILWRPNDATRMKCVSCAT